MGAMKPGLVLTDRRTGLPSVRFAGAPLLRPFTPRNLPSLKLWLAADRIAGLSDGDPVTTWSDLSGQGNHATQSTPSAKPLYKVGIANGRPGVLFDGVDDFLSLPVALATMLVTTTAKTVFVVAKWVVVGNTVVIIGASNGGGSNRFAIRSITPTDRWEFLYTTGSAATTATGATPAPSTTTAQVAEVVQSGTSLIGLANGSVIATVNDAGSEATATAGSLGAHPNGASQLANVYLMEVVADSAGLSASDRARVRRYLGAKYSVAVS